MSTQLSIPQNFGAVSKLFAGQAATNDELGSGITSSYGVIGYRGKVWSIKYQGKETPLMRDDGDGPRGSIEVVLVKSASAISKIFYKGGFVEGANQAPDCWSSNGLTPDSSAQNKQNSTCGTCPMNAWGSRTTEAGKGGKACSDARRIAVVPVNDIQNVMMDGPMLLRVPAASLKDLKAYGDQLNTYGYPYYAVATRISFDPKEAYPKFVFGAIRPLTDAEAKQVLDWRGDQKVSQLLNESSDVAPAAQEEAPAASPFEQPPVQAAPAPAPQPAPVMTSEPKKAAPKKKAENIAVPTQTFAPAPSVTAEGNTPDSFDSLLNDIL